MVQFVAARRIAVGAVAVATMLSVPAPGAAAGGGPRGDLRVSPDDQPGAYRRMDGGRDAITDACSTRRRQQAEPAVALNPHNPKVIAAAAMDACIALRNPSRVLQPQHALALYRSTDRGRTWRANLFPGYAGDPAPTGPTSELGCGMQADPVMAFDRDGRLFVGALCVVFGPDLLPRDFYTAVATFDKDGSRFSSFARVDPQPAPERDPERVTDKPALTVDTTRGPHSGNVYVTYVDCPGPPGGPCARLTDANLHIVRSTDHGRTFSAPVVIPPPESGFAGFADMAVGPDGTVYVTFRTTPMNGQRPIWLSRSTDGGRTFSTPQLVARFTTFDSGQFTGGPGGANGNCGDGTFACASGFNLWNFSSFPTVIADRSGVHVAWNQELPSGQSKVFVRSSPDGVAWPTPGAPVDAVPVGHQWWPDLASVDGEISLVFLDSRVDPAYDPNRPVGNTALGTNPGPAVDTIVASSRDGGRTWRQKRLSRRSSQPNYETFHETRVPWWGDYIYISGVSGVGTFAVWPDSRDIVPGDDTKPDSQENGFDVYAPCAWQPNTVFGPPLGYASPPYSDACLDQGGLDSNIYGAWVKRKGRHRGHDHD
jgi:hypothetical protein